jgi:uncharacterized protein (TIGR04255 family)
VDLSRYFLNAAKHVEGLPGTTTSFVHRDELRYDDGVALLVTFATLPAQAGVASYLLDIDLFLLTQPPLAVKSVMDRLDDLRERERNVFENIITDELRGVFDAE